MTESVERGREAIALFQEIGDRWGEVMATGPVVRVARRARPRRRVRRHARALPRDLARHARRGHAHVPRGHGVARRPPTGPARRRPGDPRARSTSAATTTAASSGSPTAARRSGLTLLQLGKVDDAIDVLERGYADVDRRRPGDVDRLPPRARVRGRAAHRRSRRRDRRAAAAHRRNVLGPHPRALGRELRPHAAGRARRAWPGRRRLRDRDRDRRAARARDRRARAGARCSRRSAPTTPRTPPTTPPLQLDALGLSAEGWLAGLRPRARRRATFARSSALLVDHRARRAS